MDPLLLKLLLPYKLVYVKDTSCYTSDVSTGDILIGTTAQNIAITLDKNDIIASLCSAIVKYNIKLVDTGPCNTAISAIWSGNSDDKPVYDEYRITFKAKKVKYYRVEDKGIYYPFHYYDFNQKNMKHYKMIMVTQDKLSLTEESYTEYVKNGHNIFIDNDTAIKGYVRALHKLDKITSFDDIFACDEVHRSITSIFNLYPNCMSPIIRTRFLDFNKLHGVFKRTLDSDDITESTRKAYDFKKRPPYCECCYVQFLYELHRVSCYRGFKVKKNMLNAHEDGVTLIDPQDVAEYNLHELKKYFDGEDTKPEVATLMFSEILSFMHGKIDDIMPKALAERWKKYKIENELE
jgi:hypothetical protein